MNSKYFLLTIFLAFSKSLYAQVPSGTWIVNPYPFAESNQITVTVKDINSGNLSGITDIYLWTWYSKSNGESGNPDSQWNGEWNNSKDQMKMISNGDGSYSFTYVPSTFYNDTGIGTIGVLAKAKDGSGDKKTEDYLIDVGTFTFNLVNPSSNVNVINSGDDLIVDANTNVSVNFVLKKGNEILHQTNNKTEFNYTISNIVENSSFELSATDIASSSSQSLSFDVFIKPSVELKNIPTGSRDGFNIINDNAVFVLYAPGKEFVYLSGSFNNWSVSEDYLMYYDQIEDRYWFELESLDKNSFHAYQYVVDGSIIIADPYSTMILDSYNDSYLCLLESCGFSTIPSYPSSNKHAASVFRINNGFNWEDQAFVKPEKENLVIYEILLRDFHDSQSFNSVISKLDYLEGLGINAIELMPINEFDGNNSWGYNPSFHMAIDKKYGSPSKFKELVNECHKRGIAVILDVVYNHATGQNSYFRLWNSKPNQYDGSPTSNNPFFQDSPISESYLNYFNDINHDSQSVKDYLKRINQFFINEYHVDGFRFDLSKGFTNENIAENYISSRVNYLKSLADDIWEIDTDSYVILEHFQNFEEMIFSDYGILSWGEENYHYNEATMGFPSDFKGISYKSRGFSSPTLVGFMESHDKERLMYKNITYGNSTSAYDAKHFSNAIDRMKAAGALFFTVPGPKMVWQFGELGYDLTINYCEDGSISESCRLSEKPSAFSLDMDKDLKRIQLLNTWSRLISLKKNEKIFKTEDFTISFSSELKYMHLYYNGGSEDDISSVVIASNFGVEEKQISSMIIPEGEWFDVYNNNIKVNVVSSNPISLMPGQFIIYANKPTTILDDPSLLLSSEKRINRNFKVYPNPIKNRLYVDADNQSILPLKFSVYDNQGKKIYKSLENTFSFVKDFSSFSSNIYIIRIEDDESIYKTRVIKK